jgi:hypothetical protein
MTIQQIKNNQKILTIIVIVLALIAVGGVLLLQKYRENQQFADTQGWRIQRVENLPYAFRYPPAWNTTTDRRKIGRKIVLVNQEGDPVVTIISAKNSRFHGISVCTTNPDVCETIQSGIGNFDVYFGDEGNAYYRNGKEYIKLQLLTRTSDNEKIFRSIVRSFGRDSR